MYNMHARKQINQAAGFTHLSGALGFPGMNWAVLTRVPETEINQSVNQAIFMLYMTILLCFVVIIVLGYLISVQKTFTARGEVRLLNDEF